MKEKFPEIEFPIEEYCTIEQAIRFIADNKPPLMPAFEKIENYEPILETWDTFVTDNLFPRYYDAWVKLIKRLATGKLEAYGEIRRRTELDEPAFDGWVYMDENRNIMDPVLLKKFPTPIPKRLWGSEYTPPYDVLHPTDTNPKIGQVDYISDIKIKFESIYSEFLSEDLEKTGKNPKKSLRGRPTKVPEEVYRAAFTWCIATGQITEKTTKTNMASYIAERLNSQNLIDDQFEVDSIRKTWLPKLLPEFFPNSD